MSGFAPVFREAGLLKRDRAFIGWVVLTLLLSVVSVVGGIAEVSKQRETIARLIEGDREDRLEARAKQGDWGGAAYYSFHLTYDPPSNFAFAALGTRDQEPWKHRIRMLALEGQIYERDAGNPVLALTGRFDFAFFAAFVLPLVLIAVLHDLQASERGAGRHELLIATSGISSSPWRLRAWLKAGAVFIAAALPLLVGCIVSGTSMTRSLMAPAILCGYLAFWSFVSYRIARRERNPSVILATLLGVWVMVGVVGPAAGKLVIDHQVPVPQGADILMTQREAVNDAWDLPKEVTMDAFVARHPEWSQYAAVDRPFEWKWYYAFQQVGDQKAEPLSLAYRESRLHRDRLAGWFAWLTPPALLQRSLQRIADTDLRAHMEYEANVRLFHGQLREFYYGKLFPDAPFDTDALGGLPEFDPGMAAP
ncbi:MAG: DUF3526 domain-containing protein [Acidobacteriota bacterium]|nr:DUF3526 domain-containing protein [Acidobacteriota bacterium]